MLPLKDCLSRMSWRAEGSLDGWTVAASAAYYASVDGTGGSVASVVSVDGTLEVVSVLPVLRFMCCESCVDVPWWWAVGPGMSCVLGW